MTNTRSSLQTYSGWLALTLVVISLSFIGLRATATSFRFTSAPQLTAPVEFRNPFTAALDLLNPIPTSSTATFTPSLPSLIQQPTGCGASFAQAPGSPINVGSFPFSLASGDFNLDGKPDFAVTNAGSNNLTILLGNGSGGFTQPAGSPVDVGSTPIRVVTHDLNLDGKPDLVVANGESNNLTILLGNGNGSFSQPIGSPIGLTGPPNSLAVGDFNQDGKPDLVAPNFLADNVAILLGNGNGGFTPAIGSPVSVGDGPDSLVTGDFNLDGTPDLAIGNVISKNLTILLGKGLGAFMQATNSPVSVEFGPRSVAMGDFNQDGKPDFAVANSGSANITILLGNGNGGFAQAAGSPIGVGAGAQPTSLVKADFNFDGKADLAVVNLNSNFVTILQGDGSGGFTQAIGSPVTVGSRPASVVVGDFNLDGRPDFATANFNSNNVTVHLNTCPAQPCSGIAFSQPAGSPVGTGNSPQTLAVSDFNLDSKPDLAVVNLLSNSVTILLGQGNGDFTAPVESPISAGINPFSLAVGDFNLDSKPDLAVANSGSSNLTILLGNGMGGFTQPAGSPVGTGVGPSSVAVGDFNLDGKPDLAVVNLNSNNVTILLGGGSGGFTQGSGSPVSAGSEPFAVTVSDFNLDGKPDLAVANFSSNNATILLGNGIGGFTQAVGSPVGVGTGPYFVRAGDFNLDGKPDLAVVNQNSNNVTIQLGNGSGGFMQAPGSPVSTGTGLYSVAVGDFNLDGKPDLVLVSFNSNSVMILLGNGTGMFAQAAGLPVSAGSGPVSVVAGDFNLDGKPDLAVANYDSNNVTIQLNTCTPPNMPPNINCPTNITVGSVAGQNSASVPFNVTAIGLPLPTVACRASNTVITSPHVFPVGTTTVTCTASNGVAPDATCSFTVTVNRVSGSANDPLACTVAGGKVQATLNISNDGQVNQNVVNNTTFTNLTGIPGSCTVTPNVGICAVTSTGVSYSATLTPGQTVAITYLTQVTDSAPPGAQVCTNNSVSFNGGTATSFSACDVVDCPAVGPGTRFPAAAESSDQKAGSVLVYNIYTSSTDPNRQNTRINLTNTHSQLPAFAHLFFVFEGCSIADSYVCLTPNQTVSFLTSDLDPGVTGYVVVTAVDARGCPTNFNYLIGDEYVRFASGHAANLSAQAFSAIPGGLPLCDGNSVTAALNFDDISYNRAPRSLALSNIASRADGNDTMLILNRIGGNLGIGAASLGSLFGILYNDSENALSFTVTSACQLRSSVSNNFPRTTPRFESFVPAGRTGWMRFYSQNDIGIIGSAINFNPNVGSSAGAFNQGHNLHSLTLSTTNTYTIPVFPPSC